MEPQTIFIKGMVCNRCLMTVEAELLQMGYTPVEMSLGEVSFLPNKESNSDGLEERLTSLGFSLLQDKKVTMTKEVKHLVQEVYGGDFDFPERFSTVPRRRFRRRVI